MAVQRKTGKTGEGRSCDRTAPHPSACRGSRWSGGEIRRPLRAAPSGPGWWRPARGARRRCGAGRSGRRTGPPRPCRCRRPCRSGPCPIGATAAEPRAVRATSAWRRSSQPIDQVAQGQQQPGGVEADLVDLLRAPPASRWPSPPWRRPWPRRRRRPRRASRARPSAGRCPPRTRRTPDLAEQRAERRRPGRAGSCGRTGPGPGSRWCPRTGCRSWRPGCTARSGSPAGSRSRPGSAGSGPSSS